MGVFRRQDDTISREFHLSDEDKLERGYTSEPCERSYHEVLYGRSADGKWFTHYRGKWKRYMHGAVFGAKPLWLIRPDLEGTVPLGESAESPQYGKLRLGLQEAIASDS